MLFFAHVGERVLNVLDLRLACRAIQEGDYLSASAAVINAEYSVGNAVGNAVAVCPQDRIIVGTLLDIGGRVVAGLLCVAAGADALNIVVAESLDFGALFDGLLADGADLIAGVAGLEAGRFLSVHKLGLVAECGNGLLSAQDGAADLADSTLGNAGLGAGGSLCLNVHGGVLDHGDLFAFLHDDAAELAYLIAGVADFGAGRFLDIGKLVGCGVCDHRCYFNIRRTISIHEFSAAELAALVGQALMLAGCIIERVKRIAVLAGSCDGDLLACVACSSMAASALFVVNVLKATLEASCLFHPLREHNCGQELFLLRLLWILRRLWSYLSSILLLQRPLFFRR